MIKINVNNDLLTIHIDTIRWHQSYMSGLKIIDKKGSALEVAVPDFTAAELLQKPLFSISQANFISVATRQRAT